MEIRDCLGKYSFVIHDSPGKITKEMEDELTCYEKLDKIEYKQHPNQIHQEHQMIQVNQIPKEKSHKKEEKEMHWLEDDISTLLEEYPEFYEGVLHEDTKDYKEIKEALQHDKETKISQQSIYQQSWINHTEINKQLLTNHSIPRQFNEIPYLTEKITKLIMSIFNTSNSHFTSFSIHSLDLNKKLQKLDDINVRERYEIGIGFVGQNEFVEDILSSYGVSEEYETIINSLGKIIGTTQYDDPITQKIDVTYPVIYYNDPLREIIFHDITKIPNQHLDIKTARLNNLISVFYAEYLFDPNIFEELSSQFVIVIQPYRDGIFTVVIYTKKCEGWGCLQTENIVMIEHLGDYIRDMIVCLWKEYDFIQLKKKNKSHPLLVRKQMINKIQCERQINNYLEFMTVIETFVSGKK